MVGDLELRIRQDPGDCSSPRQVSLLLTIFKIWDVSRILKSGKTIQQVLGILEFRIQVWIVGSCSRGPIPYHCTWFIERQNVSTIPRSSKTIQQVSGILEPRLHVGTVESCFRRAHSRSLQLIHGEMVR